MKVGGRADGDDRNARIDSKGRFSNAKESSDLKETVEVLTGCDAFARRVQDLTDRAVSGKERGWSAIRKQFCQKMGNSRSTFRILNGESNLGDTVCSPNKVSLQHNIQERKHETNRVVRRFDSEGNDPVQRFSTSLGKNDRDVTHLVSHRHHHFINRDCESSRSQLLCAKRRKKEM